MVLLPTSQEAVAQTRVDAPASVFGHMQTRLEVLRQVVLGVELSTWDLRFDPELQAAQSDLAALLVQALVEGA